MGCDIHAFLQYRDPFVGLKSEELELGRYYNFFGALANVRGPSIAPTPPRYSWPTELTPELKEVGEDIDFYHTYSWLTLSECEAAQDALRLLTGEEYRPFTELIERMEKLTELGADPLFLFTFDN